MAQVDFKKRLAGFKNNWNKAKKAVAERGSTGGKFECPVDDGVYRFNVVGCELTESQKGNLQVHWQFAVADGEAKGEIVHDWDGAETDKNFEFLQQKFETLGYECGNDPSVVADLCDEVEKARPLIKGRVRTKANDKGDEYTHVYINRLLDAAGAEVETDAPQEQTEEEPAVEEEAPAEEVAAPEAEAEPSAEAEAEPAAEEPAAEEAPAEGDIALEEHMQVTFKVKGADVQGEILEFVEEDTKARVKTDKGVFKVKIEDLVPVAAEAEAEPAEVAEEEPTPEPEKPVKAAKGTVKPTAPAKPAAKPVAAKPVAKPVAKPAAKPAKK